MANNITVKDASGSNVTVKSIDNASVQLPAHALYDSTGANAASVSAANALKVDGSAVTQPVSGSVSVSGSVTANAGTNLNTSALALESGGNLAAVVAALQIMDDWDESDRAKVNLIAAQAGITGGAGAVAANTPRTTLASDDPAVTALQTIDDWDSNDRAKVSPIAGQDGVAGGSGTVGATTQRVVLATDVALPAGTNNIGDVDVLSVIPGTGATSLGKAIDTATGGTDTGVLALATRDDALTTLTPADGDNVQLRTDSTGRLWTSAAIDTALPAGTNNIGDVDVLSVVPGTGATNLGKAIDTATGGTDTGVLALATRDDALTTLTPADGDNVQLRTDSEGALWGRGLSVFTTVSTDVTRPADTTAYAVNDAMSDSTSTPTTGGFTFSNAARKSGGSGIITDAIFTSSNDAATPLQAELWIFNQAVTNINDNTAFAVTDSEIKTCVAKIPFALEDAGNNDFAHVQNLAIGFTCVGSANLRFLIRVKNAYTPASAEVVTFVLKIIQVD